MYKEQVIYILKRLSLETYDHQYENAANNKEIVDEIARDINKSIEDGCDKDWCFDTAAYGGFWEFYYEAVEVYEERNF